MQYKEEGYLPEALNNYLSRLGWSHGDNEKFSMDDFCKWFDFEHVTSSSAQFDKAKLDWLNGEYIKSMDLKKLSEIIIEKFNEKNVILDNKDLIYKAVNLYQDREVNINQFCENISYFISKPEPDKDLVSKFINIESKKNIKALIQELEKLNWEEAEINECIKSYVKNNNLKFPEIAMPLRVKIAGNTNTPNIGSIIFILGLDEVKRRVNDCL